MMLVLSPARSALLALFSVVSLCNFCDCGNINEFPEEVQIPPSREDITSKPVQEIETQKSMPEIFIDVTDYAPEEYNNNGFLKRTKKRNYQDIIRRTRQANNGYSNNNYGYPYPQPVKGYPIKGAPYTNSPNANYPSGVKYHGVKTSQPFTHNISNLTTNPYNTSLHSNYSRPGYSQNSYPQPVYPNRYPNTNPQNQIYNNFPDNNYTNFHPNTTGHPYNQIGHNSGPQYSPDPYNPNIQNYPNPTKNLYNRFNTTTPPSNMYPNRPGYPDNSQYPGGSNVYATTTKSPYPYQPQYPQPNSQNPYYNRQPQVEPYPGSQNPAYQPTNVNPYSNPGSPNTDYNQNGANIGNQYGQGPTPLAAFSPSPSSTYQPQSGDQNMFYPQPNNIHNNPVKSPPHHLSYPQRY